MRRSHLISLFILFAAVSVLIVVMAATGKSPRGKIAQPTASPILSNPTEIPQTATTEPTEEPTQEITEEPTEEPTPTPVTRPVITASDFSNYSTKSAEWNVSSSLQNSEDPESREYYIDKEILAVVDGFSYLYRDSTEGAKNIFLTFNLAYEDKDKTTLKIIDTLNKNGVKAAFFVSANYLNENPDVIKAMAESGHLVGSRGDIFARGGSGTGMTYLGTADFSDTLWAMEEAYQQLAGENTRMLYYRPDKVSPRDMAVAEAMGYTVTFRSFNYYDWDDSVDRNQALRKLLDNTCSGAIYQLSSSKVNAEILEDYIIAVKDRGYSFASLSDAK